MGPNQAHMLQLAGSEMQPGRQEALASLQGWPGLSFKEGTVQEMHYIWK